MLRILPYSHSPFQNRFTEQGNDVVKEEMEDEDLVKEEEMEDHEFVKEEFFSESEFGGTKIKALSNGII